MKLVSLPEYMQQVVGTLAELSEEPDKCTTSAKLDGHISYGETDGRQMPEGTGRRGKSERGGCASAKLD
jgi:hypothetical protein